LNEFRYIYITFSTNHIIFLTIFQITFSDHAWGGNYFIASGSLKGGRILGSFPSDLTIEGSEAFEPGIVIPTTPWEALWNGVAQWFGITTSNDLNTVLPNRNKFLGDLFSQSDLYE
jgi:uncharacterized protein (DUF1501 family)